jgi:hypothetical protein
MQNITQKTKDRVTRIPLKTGDPASCGITVRILLLKVRVGTTRNERVVNLKQIDILMTF